VDELKVFSNEELGKVRIVEIDGEPWFVGKDVAEILGYTDLAHAVLDHVDEEDRVNSKTRGQINLELGQRGGWLINESGLYGLILSSKLPTAKAFKKWVTSEVLPSIRKHGLYATDELLDNPDLIIQMATKLKEEREARRELEAENEEMRPLALFAKSVSASETSVLIGDMAKLFKQNGVDIGQKRLFAWLREKGYLMKSGSSKNLPTQKAMEKELFEVKESTVSNPDGSIRVTRTTKVTGKGQVYFVNLFLGKKEEQVS
jgi:phage antirepressor protein